MPQGRKGSFRDLKVWHDACKLAIRAYRLTDAFPKREIYGLAAQVRSCAHSVPANIAEGSARKGAGDFVRFLHISAGSLAELETYLELCEGLGYGDRGELEQMKDLADEVGKMLYGLIKSIRERAT